MKKLILFMVVVLYTTAVNAKVWRINPEDNAKADFKTLKSACKDEKVKNLDTLYCEPGYYCLNDYDSICHDSLTILGPGWGDVNYGGVSTISSASFMSVTYITANHINIQGLYFRGYLIILNSIENLTIERCRFTENGLQVASGYPNLKNIVIKNNVFDGAALSLTSGGYCTNLTILGNLFINFGGSSTMIYTSHYNVNNVGNVTIQNNTMVCSIAGSSFLIETANAVIQDNIIINTNSDNNGSFIYPNAEGNIIRKNIVYLPSDEEQKATVQKQYPDNYYLEATIEDVFKAEYTDYFEQYYQLKDGSPAKNAAYDGGDCGAFGGAYPYIVCGRPQGIPYIYDVEAPQYPKNNKLTVTFKVKGQNE